MEVAVTCAMSEVVGVGDAGTTATVSVGVSEGNSAACVVWGGEVCRISVVVVWGSDIEVLCVVASGTSATATSSSAVALLSITTSVSGEALSGASDARSLSSPTFTAIPDTVSMIANAMNNHAVRDMRSPIAAPHRN